MTTRYFPSAINRKINELLIKMENEEYFLYLLYEYVNLIINGNAEFLNGSSSSLLIHCEILINPWR